MALRDGVARDSLKIVTLAGQRYRVATRDDLKSLEGFSSGPRVWQSSFVSAQDIPPQPLAIPLATFHEGSGFSFSGLPGTYEMADGWDASSPGKIRTWGALATCAVTTLGGALPAGRKGWLFYDQANGYLYMFRGRYASKYAVNFGSGSWAKAVADFDFGASNVVAGRPQLFDGKVYIPVCNTSLVAQVFRELTLGGAGADAYASGPAGKETMCFALWEEKLARANGNAIETCSSGPLTAGNWLGTVEIGSSSDPIEDLLVWDRDLRVRNRRGLWSLDPNGRAINEIPDLGGVIDPDCAGGAPSNAWLLVPSKAGLIRWQAQVYGFVGPEQEGGLDGSLSGAGWGRTAAVAPYGRWAFCSMNSPTKGALVSLRTGRGQRQPLVPHCHHLTAASARMEGLGIVDNGATDTQSALAAIVADGTNFVNGTVNLWSLPRSGMFPADDPNVGHGVAGRSFFTSRLTDPSRSLQKKYRTFEAYVDMTPTTNIPGLQVWASIDGGSFFQLLTGAGAAATIKANGFFRVFFPTGASPSSVGAYCQLEFRIPALGGGEGNVDVTLRECVLRAEVRPVMVERIDEAVFILDDTDYLDDMPERRTIAQQEAALEALVGRDSSTGAVAFTGIDGEAGYVELRALRIQEAYWRPYERSVKIATVAMDLTRYA